MKLDPKDIHFYAVAHGQKRVQFTSKATIHTFTGDKDHKSELNNCWGELTCMDWILHECEKDYIGIANYRRMFTDEALLESETDVLYVPERFYLDHSVSEHWFNCHGETYKIPTQTLELAKQNKLPLTEEMLSAMWGGNRLNPILMFYGNKDLVKKYITVLFECMMPIWEAHKDEYEGLEGYPRRWMAYLTERIQGALLMNAEHFFGDMKIKEAPMALIENGRKTPFGGLCPPNMWVKDKNGYHHYRQINEIKETMTETKGTEPIELLATVVLNGAEDLMAHYYAVDYPVERYVVVDNSEGKFSDVTEKLLFIETNPNEYIEEVSVIRNRFNVGFGGAINQIIKQNVDCNYWFITNDDWHVKPGQLQRLAGRLEEEFDGLLCEAGNLNGYSAFVMSNEMVSQVGLMDENFYPAYCEDNDHRYRVKLAGMSWDYFPLDATHVISSTLHSCRQFEERNRHSFKKNIEYYIQKWGGDRGKEKYSTPFNLDAPIDYWPYRPDRIYDQTWL